MITNTNGTKRLESTDLVTLDNFNAITDAMDTAKVSKTGDTISLASNGLTVGTNQLVVSGGKVGIGTSSPSYKLQWANDNRNGWLDFTASSAAVGASDALSLFTNSAERVRIDSSGNLLVGTTATTNGSKLQVCAASYPKLTIRTTGGTTSNGIIDFQNNNGDSHAKIGTYYSVADLGNLEFITGSTSPTTRMVINSSGNVGIGTTSPAYKLSVSGVGILTNNVAGTSTVLRLANDDTTVGNVSVVKLAFQNGGTVKASINAAVYNNDYLTFNTGSDTERMRIDASGNVGIGTNSPNGRFEIGNLPTSISYGFIIGNGANSDNYYTSGSSGLHIFRQAGTERMRIDASGNVLIGTTSSTIGYKLSLGGGGILSGYSNGFIVSSNEFNFAKNLIGSSIYINYTSAGTTINDYHFLNGAGNAGYVPLKASAFTVSSDYRLKEDLRDYSGLEILKKIKTYDFKWKDKEERNYGVIAHELQDILPYAVFGEKDEKESEDGKTNYQSVDYSKLVPILTKAIQELYAEVQTLKGA